MGTVIPTVDLSQTIIRQVIRDGLRTAAAGADPLTDPKAASRPAKSQFILTAFPGREPFYPHIIVEEANDSAARIDRRVALKQHTYLVRITILSESATDLYKLRDQVRQWIVDNIEGMATAGYVDVDIQSSTPTTWDSTSKVLSWQITLTGKAFTN